MNNSPQSNRLPAEWEPQSGIMITWPHQNSDWVDSMDQIEAFYLQLVKHITRFEKVLIITFNEEHQSHIKNRIKNAQCSHENIMFSIIETNDTWTRDYGPITLEKKNNHIFDFRFNGWGNKFDASLDNLVTQKLVNNNTLKTQSITNAEFILEGGSIESDGKGTLLTTSSCLLTTTRNTLYSKENIGDIVESTLGINKILWLDHGHISGDDTDGHIDMLARFTDPNTIIYVKCEDDEDEHFDENCKMEQQLKTFTNAKNKPYKLKPLPFPSAIFDKSGRRLPASYANFLIINNAVLVPTYNDRNDKKALDMIGSCFPEREIIGIPAVSAIEQNGSLHCLTMQIPEGYL